MAFDDFKNDFEGFCCPILIRGQSSVFLGKVPGITKVLSSEDLS